MLDFRRNLGTIECHNDGCATLSNVSVEAYFLWSCGIDERKVARGLDDPWR